MSHAYPVRKQQAYESEVGIGQCHVLDSLLLASQTWAGEDGAILDELKVMA